MRHVSWPVVKKLADILAANPDIVEVYVEGHTDQTGPADWNQQLSQDRAESVKKMLVGYGVVIGLATYIAFRASARIAKVLGQTGINVMTRLMGLILAAMAVELLADGLIKLFPGLAR